MLGVLLHRFAPCLRPGRTAFPVLSQIDRELNQCLDPGAASAALDRSKPDLYARLRARHPVPVAQALTLKTLNLFLARHHLRARSVRVRSRPIGLVVDPSNVCQLACPGCVHSERAEALKVFDWPKGTLSARRLDSLFQLYGPYAIGVYFCSYGEPLLNLDTPKFIGLAKSYLLAAALSTSLSLRRLDAEAYVESGLDFMVLSIDGATQPVYERFRRHGHLELVLDNVRKLVEAKRRLRRRTPALCWNFLAFEHNVHEIPLAIRLARKLGVDQFRVAIPFDVG
jgi:MoaA/NifB/PqqE/SkfB family radical SAM enzyme